jgi:hypothetical protein
MPLRPRLARCLAALALVLTAALPLRAAEPWRPVHGQRLDVQLLPPLDLVRRADVLALDLFQTPPDQVRQLEARGVAALCWIAAGYWESWRPDAFAFPQGALGRNVPGRPGARWIDADNPAVTKLMERRLDLCREHGFKGAVLAGLDAAPRAGLAVRLAAAAHEKGLAVGLVGLPADGPALAKAYDFLVAADCAAAPGPCAEAAQAFRAAGKPAWLLAFTNAAARMTALCADAARSGVPLLFKTQTLTGRLHRRCGA